MWYYTKVGGRRCPIINISGGTEIMGCFLFPLPIVPLKPCSLGKGAALGMDVDVVDGEGRSVREQKGYLVARSPAPSMTKALWKDREGTWRPTGLASMMCGTTVTGRRWMRMATGSSMEGRMTPSRWRESALDPAKWRGPSSAILPWWRRPL